MWLKASADSVYDIEYYNLEMAIKISKRTSESPWGHDHFIRIQFVGKSILKLGFKSADGCNKKFKEIMDLLEIINRKKRKCKKK